MLHGLYPDRFLTEFWQKQPLFLPAAINIELPALDADELAWLAIQPDVESRLVFTERAGGKTSYRVEHGPFAEADLNALPAADWTLLVQDVEKHLPDFRDYFRLVPFIPAWRIDDLMVSFAAPGGSVGPHKDNYDVFLCQGEGSRHWRVSNDRTVPRDSSTTSLSLLEPFEPTEERLCSSGDVLYLPPGAPHWGIAKDFCTTYSIGMRAPTKEELVAGFDRIYAPDQDSSAEAQPGASLIFYSDPDLQITEARRGQIMIEAVRRIRKQKLLDDSLSDEVLMIVLGSVVTDPKAWLDPDQATLEEIEKILQGHHAMRVHGMALLAWCDTDEFRIVFANGSGREIPAEGLELVRALCDERVVMPDTIRSLSTCPGGSEFIAWLLQQGIADMG
jgi:50S ribosomal protein L16 3-hydroxylase